MSIPLSHPQFGFSYGVITGTYVGEMLVFIEGDVKECKFLSLPKNINRSIPRDKFYDGLKLKIVEPVSFIEEPEALELIVKQFKYNQQKG